MKKTQDSYIPEYQRLGKQINKPETLYRFKPKNPDVVVHPTNTFTNKIKAPVKSQINELEDEQEKINHGSFEEDAVANLQALSQFEVDDYANVIFFQGKIIEIIVGDSETEEFLDDLIFNQNKNVDPNDLEVYKKLPVKIGAHLRK